MKPIYLQCAGALALTFTIAACVPAPAPTPAPAPAPVRTPTAAPPPVVVAPPASTNWLDVPQTQGDWRYLTDASGTMAMFGNAGSDPSFALRCNPSTRQVSLLRAGSANGDVALRIRTETRDRLLTGRQVGDQLPMIETSLPARDPLLEAMIFSKGRFAVETMGLPTLYLPAWGEVTRVVEDCR